MTEAQAWVKGDILADLGMYLVQSSNLVDSMSLVSSSDLMASTANGAVLE